MPARSGPTAGQSPASASSRQQPADEQQPEHPREQVVQHRNGRLFQVDVRPVVGREPRRAGQRDRVLGLPLARSARRAAGRPRCGPARSRSTRRRRRTAPRPSRSRSPARGTPPARGRTPVQHAAPCGPRCNGLAASKLSTITPPGCSSCLRLRRGSRPCRRSGRAGRWSSRWSCASRAGRRRSRRTSRSHVAK